MNGQVYWITGLSGSGKTTIGRLLTEKLKMRGQNVLMLDGDMMREILGKTENFSQKERQHLARIYSRLCKEIASQGVDVVCSTISLFNEIQSWNKNNISKYIEIFLRVPIEELENRDEKDLYAAAKDGQKNNVYGIDMEYEEPKSPDIVIDNFGDETPESAVDKILEYVDR